MLTGLLVLSMSLIAVAQQNSRNFYPGETRSFNFNPDTRNESVANTNSFNKVKKTADRNSGTSAEESNSSRFGIELNLGGSFATRKLAGTDLNAGMGFEGIFHYRFLSHTGIFAGWGWNKFSADNSFAGSHVDFEETGYIFGLQFKHPVENTALSYYLRAAGLYNHIEVENEDGKIIGDTGHGAGWQVAGGIELALSDKWTFTPGVKYNSLSRDLEIDGNKYSLEHNYVSLRIGFLRKF